MLFIMGRKKKNRRKRERKENLIGQWKIKAIFPGQAVYPVVVPHPQEEGTSFPSMHKGTIWASSGPVNNTAYCGKLQNYIWF